MRSISIIGLIGIIGLVGFIALAQTTEPDRPLNVEEQKLAVAAGLSCNTIFTCRAAWNDADPGRALQALEEHREVVEEKFASQPEKIKLFNGLNLDDVAKELSSVTTMDQAVAVAEKILAAAGKNKTVQDALTTITDVAKKAIQAAEEVKKKGGHVVDPETCSNLPDDALPADIRACAQLAKAMIDRGVGEDRIRGIGEYDSMTRLNQALEEARNNPASPLRPLIEGTGARNAEDVGNVCMRRGVEERFKEACLASARIFDSVNGERMMREAWNQVDSFYNRKNDAFAKIEAIMRESGDPKIILPKLRELLSNLSPDTPPFVKDELGRMISEMERYAERYQPPGPYPYPRPDGKSGPIYDVTEVECRSRGGGWSATGINYKGKNVNCYIAETACIYPTVMPRRCEPGEKPTPPPPRGFPWECPPFDSACIPDYDQPDPIIEKIILIIPSGDAREKRTFNKGDARIMCGNPEVFSSNPDVCFKLTGQKPIDKEICPGMPTYDPELCKKEGGTPVKSYESKACGTYWSCEKKPGSTKQGPIEGVFTQEECSKKYPDAMWSVPDKVCYYYPSTCAAWTAYPSPCAAGTSRKYAAVMKPWECPEMPACTEDKKPPISGPVTEAEVACLRGRGISETTINNFKRAGDGFVNFTDPEMAIMKANMPIIDACRICAVKTTQGACLDTSVCSWNSSARSCGVASSVRVGDISNITDFTCTEGWTAKYFGPNKVKGCVLAGTEPPYIGVESMSCGTRGYRFREKDGWPDGCLGIGEIVGGAWTEFAWSSTVKSMISSGVTTAQKDAGKVAVEVCGRTLNRSLGMSDLNWDSYGVPTGCNSFSVASTITLSSYRGGIYGYPSFRICMAGYESDLDKITSDLNRGIAPVWGNLSSSGQPKVAECERQAGWGGGGFGLSTTVCSALDSASCSVAGCYWSNGACTPSGGGMGGGGYGLGMSSPVLTDPGTCGQYKGMNGQSMRWQFHSASIGGSCVAGSVPATAITTCPSDQRPTWGPDGWPVSCYTSGGMGGGGMTGTMPAGQVWEQWNSYGLTSMRRQDADSIRVARLKEVCGYAPSWASGIWLAGAGDYSSANFGMPDENICKNYITPPTGSGTSGGAGSSQCPSGFHWEGNDSATGKGVCFQDSGSHDKYVFADSPGNVITCSAATQVMGCPGYTYGGGTGSGGMGGVTQATCDQYDGEGKSSQCTAAGCTWMGSPYYCTMPGSTGGMGGGSGDDCSKFMGILPSAHSHGSGTCVGGDEKSWVYSSDPVSVSSIKDACVTPAPGNAVSCSSGSGTGGTGASSCPAGYHSHADSGGYCINDQENYSGTCYNLSGTATMTCPQMSYSPNSGTSSMNCDWSTQYWHSSSSSCRPRSECYDTAGSYYNISECMGVRGSMSGSTGGTSSCTGGQYWYTPPGGGSGYCMSSGSTTSGSSMTPDQGCKNMYGTASSYDGSKCIGGSAPTAYIPKQSLFAQVLYSILNAIMGSGR